MKNLFLFITLLCVTGLSIGVAPSISNAGSPRTQRAVMRFNRPVQLIDVTLKGEYLFVHDDDAMARGEACTFVYKGTGANARNLVLSFHCLPAERTKAGSFIVRTAMTAPGQYEIREYQFAGSTEAHVVPLHQHSEHVSIAP